MTIQEPGIHFEKGAGQRYSIHIPHRYTSGDPIPLVLLLHWGGKNYRYISRDVLEGLGLPALIKLQAIIVAPDRKRRHWANPNAEKDLLQLVDHIEKNYNIHPTQRAITGFSIGGMGVWYMAEKHPDKFACGVALASPIPPHTLDMDWKFPLTLIHSELDEMYPFDLVQKRAAMLQEKNAPIDFKTVPIASHINIRDYIDAFESTTPWIERIWGVEQNPQ